MFIRRKAAVAAALASFSLAVAACAPDDPSQNSDADPDATKIVVAPSSDLGPSWVAFAVAEEQGYFAAEGIDVEVQYIGGSSDVLSALSTNNVQIGAPTPEAVFPAREKDQDVIMIYNFTRGPVQYLAVKPDSGIKSFADLEGKTIGTSTLESGAKLLSDAMLREEGVNLDDVDYIATGTGVAAMEALDQDRVDALMLWDTEFTKMEQVGMDLEYIKPEPFAELFSTTFVAQEDWVNNNPEAVKGFGKAWAMGTVWADENPEAAIEMLWKHYPQTKTSSDPGLLQEHVEIFQSRHEAAMFGDPIENKIMGEYPEEGVEKWIEFATDYGIASGEHNPEDLYTNKYVEYYNDFDVDEVRESAANYEK